MKANDTSSATHLPLVTVVTATYNLIQSGRQDYIRECIESAHTQTYPNIEHLIIDGTSRDGTLDLLREYEQKGWVTIHSEPDKGIYDAFNKGIARAQGKYIAFLNSDDFWHDSRGIEAAVEQLERLQADFSYAPVISMSEHQQKTLEPQLSNFLFYTPFCHQTMFTRTESLRQLGGFNLNYKICADYDLILRLILTGAAPAWVPHCFTTFRDGGMSTNCEREAIVVESNAIRCSNFGAHITRQTFTNEELYTLDMHALPFTFKNALDQKLHPTIREELNTCCKKDWLAGVFYYRLSGKQIWRFRARKLALWLISLVLPNWYTDRRKRQLHQQ